jgi:hypothetical protein
MNKNYIGVVVKDENGNLSFEREQISKDYEDLKDRLRSMCDNSNRTLLDLQTAFSSVFRNSKNHYPLCLSYYYNDSYIIGINYPQEITYDEYQEKMIRWRPWLLLGDLMYGDDDTFTQERIDNIKDRVASCIKYLVQSGQIHWGSSKKITYVIE